MGSFEGLKTHKTLYLQGLERVKGIEPSFRFRKADMHKTLYYQHIQTRLTWVDFSIIFSTTMASIHQRPSSPYWHASYLGPDGRWILRSTKQKDRQSALAVAMEFERASKLARRGELVEAQAREVLKDIMKRADMGETLQTVSIKSHFDTWLASKRDRKSEGTGERYGVAVEEFLKTLGNRASKNLTSLTAADVQRFLDSSHGQGACAQDRECGREDYSRGIERGPAARFDSYQSRRSRGTARSHRHGTRHVHPGGSEDARGHGGRRMEAVNHARLFHRGAAFRLLPDAMGRRGLGR